MIRLALAVLHLFHPTPEPYWLNGVPSCPVHYAVYSVEKRALDGRDSAVCVREVVR